MEQMLQNYKTTCDRKSSIFEVSVNKNFNFKELKDLIKFSKLGITFATPGDFCLKKFS